MANAIDRSEIKKVVKEIVEENLSRIIEEELVKKEKKFGDISIIERIIKVEQSIDNVNKRIEDFIRFVDKRFEQVDKRFEQVDKRFEQVDKRFEEMLHYMDKRFEDLNKRINFMSWFIPTIITVVIAVLKFL